MKDIVFLLPTTKGPVGGFKVVFEYANRFAADGYTVGIVYAVSFFFSERSVKGKIKNMLRFIKGVLKFFYHTLTRKFRAENWFPLDKKISQRLVFSLSECFVPNSKVYVATAVGTSPYLNNYKINASKIYFVQGFENWNWATERVIATYHYPLRKIAISKWLVGLIEKSGETATFIPNGFDFNYFRKYISYENKNKLIVTMSYNKSPGKGCEDSFKALNIVKTLYPDLTVNVFGAGPRPVSLPAWYRYCQRPDKDEHNRIYNEAGIFLAASHAEGWGLPVGEAMICGAAVVCTDIGGFKEMCIHGETALLSPPREPELLAENVIRLIEDDELRYRIAKTGHDNIKKFTWEKSYNKFREMIDA
ncbi:MAG: glycosyltransferase family 4 protein [Tannerellaceae bacterium]|jgi:glycosyltransferase involved in cell wall biosynthesis|nr:glycosyltransferase family 4 protein [Tannerellaceae bacterium]